MRGQILSRLALGVALLALAPMLGSCATREQRLLDAKVKAEPQLESAAEIAARGAQTFLNSTNFTADQKQRLLNIHTQVFVDSMAIGKEIGQAKSLIFKTIAAAEYKKADIEMLKKKIIDLDRKRLEIMFKALDDVEIVIGHGPEAAEFYPRLDTFERIRF